MLVISVEDHSFLTFLPSLVSGLVSVGATIDQMESDGTFEQACITSWYFFLSFFLFFLLSFIHFFLSFIHSDLLCWLSCGQGSQPSPVKICSANSQCPKDSKSLYHLTRSLLLGCCIISMLSLPKWFLFAKMAPYDIELKLVMLVMTGKKERNWCPSRPLCVCACVFVYVRVCVCACMCKDTCLHMIMCVCVYHYALYECIYWEEEEKRFVEIFSSRLCLGLAMFLSLLSTQNKELSFSVMIIRTLIMSAPSPPLTQSQNWEKCWVCGASK